MGLFSWTRRPSSSGISASGLMAAAISSMPYIRMAKPTKAVPTLLRLSRLENMIIRMPMKARMGEKFLGFSSCRKKASLSMPESEVSQAVKVVPMLAPKITFTVWENCMMPELTRPTSMTVVEEEDCTAMVITAPRTMLRRGFAVSCRSISSSFPPDIFSRLEDMTLMP